MMAKYVHGYTEREAGRLQDQADTLERLLHHDTRYAPGSTVLEAGCGIGSQTVILARQSPGAQIFAVDISADSLIVAREAVAAAALDNVRFQAADIHNLPLTAKSFDHIFICFVLEHLTDPLAALRCLRPLLKAGGTITVIEGDHGSFYCHPHSDAAVAAVNCLVEVQRRLGGNALIGRQLYPLLDRAGYRQVHVSPRMVYVDSSKPALVDGFSKKTFIAMVQGVRRAALEMGLIDEVMWDKGISDLFHATGQDGTFCYTFFKGYGLV